MTSVHWRHVCDLNPKADPDDFDPDTEECGGCIRAQASDLSSPLWAEWCKPIPSEPLAYEEPEERVMAPVDGFCLECGQALPEDSHVKRMYCGDKCRKRYDRRHGYA
ncbi:hypothetical protein BU52_10690 [Streptomyces toyocaensis]|uniref:Uncharacterized protein n=1 Tax=Streptomyces toyocaensis TaxID=55952 RepID=A0A081XU33_STRTO|nr:hypothetical protein [Streptomyces toyocaensis]KES07056.1 hypothetical protein BU52_10690 [Streptomyces toyocaensis]